MVRTTLLANVTATMIAMMMPMMVIMAKAKLAKAAMRAEGSLDRIYMMPMHQQMGKKNPHTNLNERMEKVDEKPVQRRFRGPKKNGDEDPVKTTEKEMREVAGTISEDAKRTKPRRMLLHQSSRWDLGSVKLDFRRGSVTRVEERSFSVQTRRKNQVWVG
jgi:hypothetical protein